MTNPIRFSAAALAFAAVLGVAAPASAQQTASADARAEILAALKLTKVAGSVLDFGDLIIANNAGNYTLTLDPSTMQVTCPTGLVCTGVTSGAQFHVEGQGGKQVRVDLPLSASLSNGSGGSLTADTFTMSSPTSNTIGSSTVKELALDAKGLIQSDSSGNPLLKNKLDASGNPIPVKTITLDATSQDAYFTVGADLHIPGSAAVGVYQGTFNVSVDYN